MGKANQQQKILLNLHTLHRAHTSKWPLVCFCRRSFWRIDFVCFRIMCTRTFAYFQIRIKDIASPSVSLSLSLFLSLSFGLDYSTALFIFRKDCDTQLCSVGSHRDFSLIYDSNFPFSCISVFDSISSSFPSSLLALVSRKPHTAVNPIDLRQCRSTVIDTMALAAYGCIRQTLPFVAFVRPLREQFLCSLVEINRRTSFLRQAIRYPNHLKHMRQCSPMFSFRGR